ncbi:hypothetical protein MHBO_003975 [Bonamia ostreae]|uniref:Matrin-type domain-containing protein n=1 Tax=Bonamia ostreae TaxID=126728 RepID=A0ABV2AS08_9EUKA
MPRCNVCDRSVLDRNHIYKETHRKKLSKILKDFRLYKFSKSDCDNGAAWCFFCYKWIESPKFGQHLKGRAHFKNVQNLLSENRMSKSLAKIYCLNK